MDFVINIPVDVKLGLALPQSGSPHEAQKVRLRPGAAPKSFDVADSFKDIAGLSDTDIDNYSIVAASVMVEYSQDSGASWSNLADAVGDIAGLENSEVTIDTSNLLSDKTFTVAITDGAVASDVLASDVVRFRLSVTLTDDAPAPVQSG